MPSCRPSRPIEVRFPSLQLALGLILADAIAFLNLAGKLITPTRDLVNLIVGKLAPLLLHFAFELFPVAFDAVPIHGVTPFDGYDVKMTTAVRAAAGMDFSNCHAILIYLL